MESFTAETELARLEARLNMKIPATGDLLRIIPGLVYTICCDKAMYHISKCCILFECSGMSKPVATPSRAVGKGPVPVPSCGGVKVGTKQTHGGTKSNMAPMVNPSSAHSTPIKSPEQKKMRPSSVGTDDSSVRRNLTPALTKIEPESQPEETSAHAPWLIHMPVSFHIDVYYVV